MDSITTFTEIQKHNKFVFKKLFESLYEDLVFFANGYLFDVSASEDIVQETFIQLWEKAETITIKNSLKAYLYSMVRNRCLNYLKTIKITDSSNILDFQAIIVSDYDLDDYTNEDKEIIYSQILKIIETLPAKMQTIVKLRFMNNYKYSEIAEEMNVSVNTVKTQLKRAKIKISSLISSILILLSTPH
ncbi:RNA polymerase sigma-70 factor [Sediminicola luteus]|uniref:RNA polymerase sigma-70 factor n=1 Tax=Sediminicola luteus TaxID=319238 RepID=A0ABV2TYF8_9FLAO